MSTSTTLSATVKKTHEMDQILSNALNHAWHSQNTDNLSKFGVDFDDPRVREYTEDEVTLNRTWMALSTEFYRAIHALSVSDIPPPLKPSLTSLQ